MPDRRAAWVARRQSSLHAERQGVGVWGVGGTKRRDGSTALDLLAELQALISMRRTLARRGMRHVACTGVGCDTLNYSSGLVLEFGAFHVKRPVRDESRIIGGGGCGTVVDTAPGTGKGKDRWTKPKPRIPPQSPAECHSKQKRPGPSSAAAATRSGPVAATSSPADGGAGAASRKDERGGRAS